MGCDIHTYTEKRERTWWVPISMEPPPFDCRSYGMFGFLAGVRNYSAVPVIAQPRGLPPDLAPLTISAWESWDMDAHTASWLLVEELAAFDYDVPMVDRRVARQTGPNSWDGGCTGTVDEGEKTTFRDFLGEGFFADIERMKAAGVDRIVFWFDN